MDKYVVVPNVSVNGVQFGCSRVQAREVFGDSFRVFKKTPLSQNTTDDYKEFHVFYTVDDKFEAIEFFGSVKVVLGRSTIFPGKVRKLQKLFPDLVDDGDGFTSVAFSVGVTVDEDDSSKIDSILFGCENYFG